METRAPTISATRLRDVSIRKPIAMMAIREPSMSVWEKDARISRRDGIDHVNALCTLFGSQGDIVPWRFGLPEEAGAGANSFRQPSPTATRWQSRCTLVTKDAPTPINNGLTIPSGHTLTLDRVTWKAGREKVS